MLLFVITVWFTLNRVGLFYLLPPTRTKTLIFYFSVLEFFIKKKQEEPWHYIQTPETTTFRMLPLKVSELKILSVRQPAASFLVKGLKDVENRSTRLRRPTDVLVFATPGTRLCREQSFASIVKSLKADREQKFSGDESSECVSHEHMTAILHDEGLLAETRDWLHNTNGINYGSIVGYLRLVPGDTGGSHCSPWRDVDINGEPVGYGWRVVRAMEFKVPVKSPLHRRVTKGRQTPNCSFISDSLTNQWVIDEVVDRLSTRFDVSCTS